MLPTLIVNACAVLAPQAAAPATCGFPVRTPLSFAGETSLKLAGLLETDDQDGQNRVGELYVTAERFPIDMDPGSTRRRFCMLYPGGDSAHGPVYGDWEPPS